MTQKLFSLIGAAPGALRPDPEKSLPVGNPSLPEGPLPHGWPTVAVCFFLAAAVWAVFGQTLHADFVNYDDPAYIYKNPIITQGLNWPGMVWVFTHNNGGTWFPLTDLSHMLDWQLYGANAGGHHLTNVVLHAATAIFLFLVVRNMTGAFWSAAFVAAVFALHPLRVESVAWVVERKDVLSGFFFMLTLWAWARYAQKSPPPQVNGFNPHGALAVLNPRRWTLDYHLALAFFVLGLLSKTMLVTLPIVLLLLDYWPLNRLPATASAAPRARLLAWLGLILEKFPFLLLSAAASVVTVLTQKNAVGLAQNLTFPWRIANALVAYVDYLGHLLYPVGLAVSYPHPGLHPPLGSVVLSALILISISVGVMAGRRRHPELLVGWLWYLGMLLPVIDIMQAGQNARADRYTYLPHIGMYILLTWGAVNLCAARSWHRAVPGIAAAAILAGLLAGSYLQTGYWKDSVSLWTRTLACTPDNSFAHNNLGNALVARGRDDQAIHHFERALRLNPEYADAHLNLGAVLDSRGETDEAIHHFERALQLNPYTSKAHYYLGDEFISRGKIAEAIGHFEQALQIRPDYPEVQYNLGLALALQGKWNEAIPHYERALHRPLGFIDAQYISGVALAARNMGAAAAELFQEVLLSQPDFTEAHIHLGEVLAGQGKSAEAVQQFQRALSLATAQANATLAESIRVRLQAFPPALLR